MPRIIAGSAGGTPVTVPGSGTRPTSDRVRESLFSALESADLIAGARCADLYAGSGALGLEALSRGAAEVELVEKSPAAARVIRANADRVRRAAGAEASLAIRRQSVASVLQAQAGPWDLVFADPPYDLPETEVTAMLDALVPSLAADAVVILERASRSADPVLPERLHLQRTKRYGDTTLWWLGVTGQPATESQSR